jgi:hypothetical protein
MLAVTPYRPKRFITSVRRQTARPKLRAGNHFQHTSPSDEFCCADERHLADMLQYLLANIKKFDDFSFKFILHLVEK